MKKTTLAVLLFAQLCAVPAYSGGIPVIDGAAIAQAVALVQEAQSQLKELQDQVKTAKSQLDAYKQEVLDTKKRLEGFTDYSAIFGSAEAYFNDFWKELEKDLSQGDIQKLKEKYGFDFDEYSDLEKEYKEKFQQVRKYEVLEKDIQGSADRISRAQKAFQQAKTPQQREEMGNNILIESAALQAKLAKADAEIRRMEKEQKLREEAAALDYLNKNFRTK